MIRITTNLIGTIVKHIHWCIWSFCLLFLVFKEVITLPLELLYNFNFIPEYILNLSKITSTKSIEVITPNELPNYSEDLMSALKLEILSLKDQMAIMNNNFIKLFSIMQDNNALIQQQLNSQKDLFMMVDQKLNSLNMLNDLKTINYKLQDISMILEAQSNGQIEIANRVISQIKDTKSILTTLDNDVLNINKSILNLDFNKPFISINDVLNQMVINQKDLYTMYQNTQDMNLQGFNTLFQSQEVYFAHTQEQLNNIFSKVHEVRNHNLSLHQQLSKTIDIKLVEQQNEIIHQIIDEINRPKTSTTEINSVKSWSGFFDKKK